MKNNEKPKKNKARKLGSACTKASQNYLSAEANLERRNKIPIPKLATRTGQTSEDRHWRALSVANLVVRNKHLLHSQESEWIPHLNVD
jgi:hypothetical protein